MLQRENGLACTTLFKHSTKSQGGLLLFSGCQSISYKFVGTSVVPLSMKMDLIEECPIGLPPVHLLSTHHALLFVFPCS